MIVLPMRGRTRALADSATAWDDPLVAIWAVFVWDGHDVWVFPTMAAAAARFEVLDLDELTYFADDGTVLRATDDKQQVRLTLTSEPAQTSSASGSRPTFQLSVLTRDWLTTRCRLRRPYSSWNGAHADSNGSRGSIGACTEQHLSYCAARRTSNSTWRQPIRGRTELGTIEHASQRHLRMCPCVKVWGYDRTGHPDRDSRCCVVRRGTRTLRRIN